MGPAALVGLVGGGGNRRLPGVGGHPATPTPPQGVGPKQTPHHPTPRPLNVLGIYSPSSIDPVTKLLIIYSPS
jgi:hypothetical protein